MGGGGRTHGEIGRESVGSEGDKVSCRVSGVRSYIYISGEVNGEGYV